ncbi:hypothetical protein CEP54_002847 [Fusarium duplospermum]|uniref:Uncharacterized protein n=1 Tax=Fusarium duplospermum TaxID=1325734 RepID=A0A428QSZ5_9HYPO|nr:hypothetical protein CEP54_002847 [Fusarium duplospermum]
MEFPRNDREARPNTGVNSSESSTLAFPPIDREARSDTGLNPSESSTLAFPRVNWDARSNTAVTTSVSSTMAFPSVDREARLNAAVATLESFGMVFPSIDRRTRSHTSATSSTMAANQQSLVFPPLVGSRASMAHPPGPPTSFYLFPLLPFEIREYIWELAIDVKAPRGYNVGFTKTQNDLNSPTITWGLRKLMQVEDPRPGPCNRTRNVMATGLRAAIVVQEKWGSWEPDVPFMLEDRSTADSPYDMAKKELPGSRRIQVDAANDLMLIPKIGRSRANYNAPEIYLPHKIVAHRFEWLCLTTPVLLSTRLQDMLRLCPVARVCYVVIHDMRAFRSQGVDARFETLGGRDDLEWYREQHELVEPQTSSMTYQIGNRIYYEIKIEDFPITRDLRIILGEMRLVEEWHRTDYPGPLQRPPLAVRLMTWRRA